jgi:hypothetical protein
VTAEVTGFDGSQFSINRGTKQGVYSGPVIVWASAGDFHYPIAETVANPAINSSVLTIREWNRSNKQSEKIIEDLRSNQLDLQKYKLYATTKDIPALEKLLEGQASN